MIDLPVMDENKDREELDPRINFFNNINGALMAFISIILIILIIVGLVNILTKGSSFGSLGVLPLIVLSILLFLSLLGVLSWYYVRQNTNDSIGKFQRIIPFLVVLDFFLVLALGLGILGLVIHIYLLSNYLEEDNLSDDPLFNP